MKFKHRFNVKFAAALAIIGALSTSAIAADGSLPIRVVNPKKLGVKELPCERIAVGKIGDYKANLAKLPSGELLLIMFEMHKPSGKTCEPMVLYRSGDGGKTWSEREKPDLLGREPYLTVISDGTIFITTHLLAKDVRNKYGYCLAYVHRSSDEGKTWETLRIGREDLGGFSLTVDVPHTVLTVSRNILEMADGMLVMGVDNYGGPHFVWHSTDKGKTWSRHKCKPVDFVHRYGFFSGETWLWQARSGKIIALVRVDSEDFPLKKKLIGGLDSDQDHHEMLWESTDRGLTFRRISDFGDYSQMYPSLLRLRDGRLLYTYTQRALHKPLGVRALVGSEQEDGFAFEFDSDLLLIDYKTPHNQSSGGGFGPTVELADGTLVTGYTYRGEDGKTYAEVCRWRLPKAR